MIKRKKKDCKECGKPSLIFSKGLCEFCSNKDNKGLNSNSEIKSSFKPIKRITQRRVEEKKITSEKRGVYFEHHIKNIINNSLCCQECGDRLKGDISEIAHIISKSKNPEIEDSEDNILYLCGVSSTNQCHSKFDQSLSKRETMKVFSEVLKRFNLIESKIIHFTNEVNHIIKAIKNLDI